MKGGFLLLLNPLAKKLLWLTNKTSLDINYLVMVEKTIFERF